MKFSCGRRSITARATVSPPTPESNMPMGLSSIRSHANRRLPHQRAGQTLDDIVEIVGPRAGGEVLPPAFGEECDNVAAFHTLRRLDGTTDRRARRDSGEDRLFLGQ